MNLADEVKVKTFPVKMSPKLNNLVREHAEKEGVSAHQFILRAICDRMDKSDRVV